jgi:tRNA wybutosine-synthesizing protein 3
LGLLPSSENVWFEALNCLKKDGGWLHIHMNVPEEKIESWTQETITRLEKMSNRVNENWRVITSNLEKVKWYAPYIRHVVLDVEIK